MKRLRIMGTWIIAAVLLITVSGVTQVNHASASRIERTIDIEGTIDSLTENSPVINGQTVLLKGAHDWNGWGDWGDDDDKDDDDKDDDDDNRVLDVVAVFRPNHA